jgi:hypothetical protein
MIRKPDGMQKIRDRAAARSSLVQRMEDRGMSEGDRQAAVAWVSDGESLADFVCRAADSLRSTASFLEHYFAQHSR